MYCILHMVLDSFTIRCTSVVHCHYYWLKFLLYFLSHYIYEGKYDTTIRRVYLQLSFCVFSIFFTVSLIMLYDRKGEMRLTLGTHFCKAWQRREIITVRGPSYVLRLPKYWPPTPLSARRLCTPRLCCGGRTHSPGGEGGWGVNILEDARHSSVLYLHRILFAWQFTCMAFYYTIVMKAGLFYEGLIIMYFFSFCFSNPKFAI